MSDEWWMSYDLKCGERVVLVRDIRLADGSEVDKGSRGVVRTDDEGPHQSVNGTLAYIVLDDGREVLLSGSDFEPTR